MGHDSGSGRRRSAGPDLGAELFQEELGLEVVALAIQVLEYLGEAPRLDVGDCVRARGRFSDADSAGGDAPRTQELPKSRRSGEGGMQRDVTVVDAVVDRQGRQRRRLEQVEGRFPPGRCAPTVEPGFVAENPPVDAQDPCTLELRRKPRDLERREGGVAEPLQIEVAVPDAAVLEAGREHLGAEAVRRPQLDERRIGDRELLVRRRDERCVGIALEHGGAARQLERDHPRGRRGVPGHGQRLSEPGRQRNGPGNGDDRQPEQDCGDGPAHRRIVPWPPDWACGPSENATWHLRPARRAAMNGRGCRSCSSRSRSSSRLRRPTQSVSSGH